MSILKEKIKNKKTMKGIGYIRKLVKVKISK